jgi:hypothetical protein
VSRWAARLPWLLAAAFFGAAFAWLDLDPRVPREAFQSYSIHNRGDEGLSLAHAYLAAGRPVETLIRPLERAFLPPDAVLFRVRPNSAVPPGLRKPEKGG